jgi:hypothetical protein
MSDPMKIFVVLEIRYLGLEPRLSRIRSLSLVLAFMSVGNTRNAILHCMEAQTDSQLRRNIRTALFYPMPSEHGQESLDLESALCSRKSRCVTGWRNKSNADEAV